MSENKEIICKPTQWFIWRAVLMSAMFLGFGGYFYYDGAVGYKKQNVQYYEYMAYLQVKNEFEQHRILEKNKKELEQTKDADTWRAYALSQKTKVFVSNKQKEEITDVEGCFPDGFEFPKKWPTVFSENYDTLVKEGGAFSVWKEYTAAKGMEDKAEEHFNTKSEIEGQFNWAIGSGVLGGVALFFLFRTMARQMKIDGQNFTAPNGAVVPLASIFKIDKRKWKRKGLAYVYYKDQNDSEKKARIDGMVYGQFDAEDPNNAENLYAMLESKVTAEIIDYEEDEDADEESETEKTTDS